MLTFWANLVYLLLCLFTCNTQTRFSEHDVAVIWQVKRFSVLKFPVGYMLIERMLHIAMYMLR